MDAYSLPVTLPITPFPFVTSDPRATSQGAHPVKLSAEGPLLNAAASFGKAVHRRQVRNDARVVGMNPAASKGTSVIQHLHTLPID